MANNNFSLEGIFLPIITPFDDQLNVDYKSLKSLCEHYLGKGIAGFVPLGSTGEAALLTSEERQKVLETIASYSKEAGLQCIVGIGELSTQKVKDNIDQLCSIEGVTAQLLVAPPYVKPSQEGIVKHFEILGSYAKENHNVPTIIYNVPSRVGVNISSQTINYLSTKDYIIGLKQSKEIDFETIEILDFTRDQDFSYLAGDGINLLPVLSMGAKGTVLATAHLRIDLWKKVYEANKNNLVDDSIRAIFTSLGILENRCFAKPNPTIFKGLLHRQNLISTPNVRMPLLNATKDVVDSAWLQLEELEKF